MVALAGGVDTLGKRGGVKCTVLVFEPDPACRGRLRQKKKKNYQADVFAAPANR